MIRRLRQRYSLGEEIFSSVVHGVGALLAIAATVLLIVFSVMHKNVLGVVSSAIYGGTMIILYTMSTLYHSLTNRRAKRTFQVIDHCSIFLLIAGTYTPICLCTLINDGGIPLLCIIWAAAIVGIVLNAVNLRKFKKPSMFLYVIMGLAIVVRMNRLPALLGAGGTALLSAGGAVYLIGIIFYVMKRVKYTHPIWHLFVLAGSVLHFFCILLYVI